MGRTTSTFDIDARLRAIASQQLGLIAFYQATECGIDKHALARRRDSGALIPVYSKVMRIASAATTPNQRALAASLAIPGSVVAATSAAIVHEMPLPPRVLSEAHDAVVSVPNNSSKQVPGVHAMRHLVVPPSAKWLTTRLATPAGTLLLLPRFVDDWVVERCVDHALVNRLVTVATLRELIEQTSTRAVHKRQLLLDLLDARKEGIGHRSGKEQSAARWLRNAGLTGWVPNYKVMVNGEPVEVDFGWVSVQAALEVSPFYTHGTRAAQERDAERRRLLVANNWRVIEATDDDLANERAFARIIPILRSMGAT